MVEVARNGNPSGFERMFVLPVATSRCNKKPAIGFQHVDDFADFHDRKPKDGILESRFFRVKPDDPF